MRRRLLITTSLATLVGVLCAWYQYTFDRGAGDLSWPLCAANALMQGDDPYTTCSAGENLPTNMLMTALVLVPLSKLTPALAAGLIIGLSTALLVWGILRNGSAWQLMILLAFPFWQCVQTANWTILLVAIMFSPWAYPLVLVKPHAAIPVAFARFSWRGIAIGSGIMLLTFVLMPDWPFRWWATAQTYSGGPLIAVFPPAAILFLALIRWRSEQARYLLLCTISPLRPFYDYLLLFVLPQTPRQLLLLVIYSWGAYFSWFYAPRLGEPAFIFIWLYVPCAIWVLRSGEQKLLPTVSPAAGDFATQWLRWYRSFQQRSRSNPPQP